MKTPRTRMGAPPTFGFVITLRRPLRDAVDGGRGMIAGKRVRKNSQIPPGRATGVEESRPNQPFVQRQNLLL
jgi:hypothetical protein